MATLRGDQKLMRDVPVEPQASSAIAQYVDNLPDERSFIEKLKGNSGLNATDPQSQPLILNFVQAIQTGQLDDVRVQKLIKRNPGAASVFASALDDYKRASTQQSQVKGIYSKYFQPGEQLPPDQAGPARQPMSDYQGATNALISAGYPDKAKDLSEIFKQTKEAGGGTDPAAVKEWSFYNALPKQDQARFLELKRQGYRIADIGGVPSMAPTVTGLPVVPLSTLGGEVAGKSAIEGGKKAAEVKAGAQAQAQVDLGSNLDEIQKMRENVGGLIASEGFDSIYGLKRPLAFIPSTSAANSEARRNQLEAATFGLSIQKMKGLGQLSDAEGKKMTAAYTRATNTKQSSQSAKEAWMEVNRYLDVAEKRAYQKAGQEAPDNRKAKEAAALKALRGR